MLEQLDISNNLITQQVKTPQPTVTILLVTDGTDTARSALISAIEAGKAHSGRLVIVYFARPIKSAPGQALAADVTEWNPGDDQNLKQMVRQARLAGITQVEAIMQPLQAAQLISDLARQVNARLIFLGLQLFQEENLL